LIVSVSTGACILAIADGVSRYLLATSRLGTQLPVGVLTGLLGGPFFLLMLYREGRRNG
jgi:iron complex transport system permease protein